MKKGTSYTLNAEFVKTAKLNLPTTLKTVEPHRLEALVEEDLRRHGWSGITEIQTRLPDVDRTELSKAIQTLRNTRKVATRGSRRGMKYNVATDS